MSAIRHSGTASRTIVWLMVVAAFALGTAYAAEPGAVADPVVPGDTPAGAPIPGKEPASQVAANTPGDRVVDRLKLDTTAITGNRELPKVMSIVPWKAAEPPDGPDRPMGSLIEEMLSPVDRDEFRREITYYRELTSQSSEVAGASVPAPESARQSSPSASSPGASLP